MSKSRSRIPLLFLIAGVTGFGAALIHVTGDPDMVGRRLASEQVTDAIRQSPATAACAPDGRIATEGGLDCVDYLWRSEARYRVVRGDDVRIFTLSDPARPHLIATIDGDGRAQVSKGSARTTSEFIFDILVGIVAPKKGSTP
jgi:hypothetical protein